MKQTKERNLLAANESIVVLAFPGDTGRTF